MLNGINFDLPVRAMPFYGDGKVNSAAEEPASMADNDAAVNGHRAEGNGASAHQDALKMVRNAADAARAARGSDGTGKAAEALAEHKLHAGLRGLSALESPLPPESVAALKEAYDATTSGLNVTPRAYSPDVVEADGAADNTDNADNVAGPRQGVSPFGYPPTLAPPSNPDGSNAGNSGEKSSFEIWADLSKAIKGINDDYLSLYEKAVREYTEFYREFSKILAELGNYINQGKDENYVKVDVDKLLARLQALMDKYQGTTLFSGSSDEAKAWAERLGLPASCVDGGTVKLDLGPIQSMIKALEGIKNEATKDPGLSSAKFQAWKAGFSAQEENLKNTMQTMGQKYSNAHSLYDNLVQVLSKTISAMLDTDKMFFQN
jgi:type III secretion system IpaD/SipD/SspD family effector